VTDQCIRPLGLPFERDGESLLGWDRGMREQLSTARGDLGFETELELDFAYSIPGVSRHIKCYPGRIHRAINRVTRRQGGKRWEDSPWDHRRVGSI